MGKTFDEQSRVAHLEHVVTILDEAVRSTASDPCSYEDAMDIRHRPTPCDCRPCQARAYVRAVKDWRYIGAHDTRVRGTHNPREIRMRDAWKKAIGDREFAMMLYDGSYNSDGTPRDLLAVPSARDWYVASSVVQWLATNVGMAMLHEAGFSYTKDAEDRVVLDLNYRHYVTSDDPKDVIPATEHELKALLVFARAPYQLPRVHATIVKVVAELVQRRAAALTLADIENLERCLDMIDPEASFAFERTSVLRKVMETNNVAQSGQGEIYRVVVDDGRKMRRELYAARERIAKLEKDVEQANTYRAETRAEADRLRVDLAGTEGARQANARLSEQFRDECERLRALLRNDHGATCASLTRDVPCNCGWNDPTQPNNAGDVLAAQLAQAVAARDKAIEIARRFTQPAQIGDTASKELNAELDLLVPAGASATSATV